MVVVYCYMSSRRQTYGFVIGRPSFSLYIPGILLHDFTKNAEKTTPVNSNAPKPTDRQAAPEPNSYFSGGDTKAKHACVQITFESRERNKPTKLRRNQIIHKAPNSQFGLLTHGMVTSFRRIEKGCDILPRLIHPTYSTLVLHL